MLVKTFGSAVYGVNAQTITIEVNAGGQPSVNAKVTCFIVGLADKSVSEGLQRMEAAIKNSRLAFPRLNIVVNLAPADIRKEGAAYDLPIGIGILAATGQIHCPELDRYIIMGELSLDGTIRPIKGALPMAIQARKENSKALFCQKKMLVKRQS